MTPRRLRTDILILGSGGAGLFAALHALQADPSLDVTVLCKGLLGKSGCTRMVQGGYNVALAAGDSVQRHFMDTIFGGQWLPDQHLAWTLVNRAVERVHELENELGCFFDRNPDGTLHQKAFAGQTFDRTVHKGDLTGIEIVSRLAEQLWARSARRLEEHRAIALVRESDAGAIAGVLAIDIRTGEYCIVQARAVLIATGGGPTMYRYHTPSGDKTCDGMAMAVKTGLPLRDMEMIQFHPTGLLAGAHTRMTGTVLEEGLRGAGGYLLDGTGRRFMPDYHRDAERATRDVVSRAMFEEIRAGRGSPGGGVYLEMKHLGSQRVARDFRGMVRRCADCGFDLAGDRVAVVPTAHFMMGGIVFGADGSTDVPGLYVAGEDTGGVHGANRLGGNGVADSTVFGGIAGDALAACVARGEGWREPEAHQIARAVDAAEQPFRLPPGDLFAIGERLRDLMWEHAGIVRAAGGLQRAVSELEALGQELNGTGVADTTRTFNTSWHDWLNLENLLLVSQAVVRAALAREESRGAHFRSDFTATGPLAQSRFTVVAQDAGGTLQTSMQPVQFSIVQPGESLIDDR